MQALSADHSGRSRAGSGDKRNLLEDLTIAGRRFNAWWEGYAFDADEVRREIREVAALRQWRKMIGMAPDIVVANLLWGPGRCDPGDPAWAIRHARTLGLPLKARVAIFGAGQGGPIQDLKTSVKWRMTGFARQALPTSLAGIDTYSQAATRMKQGAFDGALCFFDLHRETDPKRLLALMSAGLKPNAPVAFIDFAAGRTSTRMRSCFEEPLNGTARGVDQLASMIEGAGFRVSETDDESRVFRQLLTRGFAGWRVAFDMAASLPTARARAEHMNALSRTAHIWAERHDALRSGHLQVVRIIARKL